jgi:hypothetical protein
MIHELKRTSLQTVSARLSRKVNVQACVITGGYELLPAWPCWKA